MVRGDGTMGTATAHQGMDGFVGNHGRALQQNKGLPQLRCGAPVVSRQYIISLDVMWSAVGEDVARYAGKENDNNAT